MALEAISILVTRADLPLSHYVLSLQRMVALDYTLVKCFSPPPPALQAEVSRLAKRQGSRASNLRQMRIAFVKCSILLPVTAYGKFCLPIYSDVEDGQYW